MARKTRLLASAAAAMLAAASAGAQDRAQPDPAPEPTTQPTISRPSFDAGVARLREINQERLSQALRDRLNAQAQEEIRPDPAEAATDNAPNTAAQPTPAASAAQTPPGTSPVTAALRTPTPDDPVIYPVNWGQAAEDRQRQAAANRGEFTTAAFVPQTIPQIDNADRAGAVAQTRLPVLIPTQTALNMGDPLFLLFPADHHYTASFTGSDILVEVFGTTRAHARAPDPRAARRLRAADGDGFIIVATRYGQELSFNRYGAAYSITVECDAPEGDPRCTQEDYVRSLGRSLQIAAGSPEGG